MHEWGITQSLVEEVIREAREHGLRKVDKVRLSVGETNDLTAESLELCFQCLTKGTIAEKADLEIKKGQGRGITLDSLEGERGVRAEDESRDSHQSGAL